MKKFTHKNNKEYVIRNDMSGFTTKYINVGDNNYISVKRSFLILLIPLLVTGLGVSIFLYQSKDNNVDNTDKNPNKVTEGVDIDLSNPPMLGDQEAIDVPGLNDSYTLTANNKDIKLVNPDGNTVYFQYSVLLGDKVIFETADIPPNKMVVANLYDILDAGTYDIVVNLKTEDIITGNPTTPVSLSTTLFIIK